MSLSKRARDAEHHYLTTKLVRSRDGLFRYVHDNIWLSAVVNYQRNGHLDPAAFIFATKDPMTGLDLDHPKIAIIDSMDIVRVAESVNGPMSWEDAKVMFQRVVQMTSEASAPLAIVTVAAMAILEFQEDRAEEVTRLVREGKSLDQIRKDEPKQPILFLNLEHISGDRKWMARVHTVRGIMGVGELQELPVGKDIVKSTLFQTGLLGGWQ